MLTISRFLAKWGEDRLFKFLDMLNGGSTDQQIGESLFKNMPRQHVGRFKWLFFRRVWVLRESTEEMLTEVVKAREQFGDNTAERLKEQKVIRAKLDERLRLYSDPDKG